jgi:hypothetical protein
MTDFPSSPDIARAILTEIVECWDNLKRDEGAFPPGDRRAAMSEHRLWHAIQPAKAWLKHPELFTAGLAQREQEQDFVDMLWKWFEDRGCDLRPERRHGLTADDFRVMLDEHEAALTDTASTAQTPDLEATVSRIMRIRNGMILDGDAEALIRKEIGALMGGRAQTPASEPVDKKALLDIMNGYLVVHARRDDTFEIRGAERAAEAILLVIAHADSSTIREGK